MFTQGGLFNQFDQDYVNDYRYKRFNYRSNLDINLTKTTTLSANLSGVIDEAKKPYTAQGASGMIKNIYYATPFSSPGIIDGRWIINTTSTADNLDGNVLPFVGGSAMAYYGSGFMNTNRNKMSIDLQLKQKLDFVTKGLSWHIKGSYNSSYNADKRGSASVATYTRYGRASMKTIRMYMLIARMAIRHLLPMVNIRVSRETGMLRLRSTIIALLASTP